MGGLRGRLLRLHLEVVGFFDGGAGGDDFAGRLNFLGNSATFNFLLGDVVWETRIVIRGQNRFTRGSRGLLASFGVSNGALATFQHVCSLRS